MSERPLVIYHANCPDGFTAAWVFQKLLGECAFYPTNYGAPAPLDLAAGRRVYVVDFSYPRYAMRELILHTRSCVVLDHHKTAEAALSGILEEIRQIGQRQPGDEIVFDMHRSGAGIAWDYLFQAQFPGKEFSKIDRPWLVDYVEDRDLWRWALPQSREVSAWVAAQPRTFEAWDALAAGTWQHAASLGASILTYKAQQRDAVVSMARRERISSHVVPTVTASQDFSETAEALCERHPDAPFAACYFRRADGRWQFSLRSRNGFDVSEVAKAFGGGGHAGAAGFEVATLPWETQAA